MDFSERVLLSHFLLPDFSNVVDGGLADQETRVNCVLNKEVAYTYGISHIGALERLFGGLRNEVGEWTFGFNCFFGWFWIKKIMRQTSRSTIVPRVSLPRFQSELG